MRKDFDKKSMNATDFLSYITADNITSVVLFSVSFGLIHAHVRLCARYGRGMCPTNILGYMTCEFSSLDYVSALKKRCF